MIGWYLLRYFVLDTSLLFPQDQSVLQAAGQGPFEWVFGAQQGGGVLSGSFTRTLSFTTPKRPPQPTEAHCVQRQQFAVFQSE
jgi:hypothetical protein